MGTLDVDSIGKALQDWSVRVDIHALMELPGIQILLFETELIAAHVKHKSHPLDTSSPLHISDTLDIPEGEITSTPNQPMSAGAPVVPEDISEDLSCYQFSFFVISILTRLVIQGHTKFGLRAMKRLIGIP